MYYIMLGSKRSWHSTEGGSVIVGVERVSVTDRYPACTRHKSGGIHVGNKNVTCKITVERYMKEPVCMMMRKEAVDIPGSALPR